MTDAIRTPDSRFENLPEVPYARAFPAILPATPDAPGGSQGQHVLEALRQDAGSEIGGLIAGWLRSR